MATLFARRAYEAIILMAPAARAAGHEPLSWNIPRIVARLELEKPADAEAFVLATLRDDPTAFD